MAGAEQPCPYGLRIPTGPKGKYLNFPCDKLIAHDGPHQAVIEGAKTERSLTSGLGPPASPVVVQWAHEL